MTYEEMADFLVDTLNVEHAVNLDGGGSTAMVIQGAVANCPSDGADPPCTGNERSVPNALLLVRRDPTSTLPLADDFAPSGRSLAWDEKFSFNPVVPFSPTAPGGDGHVCQVRNPEGNHETMSIGTPGDADFAVSAMVWCDHRPEVAADGFERVGIFARDDGNANFDSPELGGGNCYALTFDTDTGRIRAGVVIGGEFTDFRESDPVLEPEDAWRLFRIECTGDRVRYLVDGQVLADIVDSSRARGRAGIAHHEHFGTDSNALGAHVDRFVIESTPQTVTATGLAVR
jgi:hypothetical protein